MLALKYIPSFFNINFENAKVCFCELRLIENPRTMAHASKQGRTRSGLCRTLKSDARLLESKRALRASL